MASGEIRLSTMTMRRMPVLAQSQTSIDMSPSADGFAPIVVNASNGTSTGISYGPQFFGNFPCGGSTCNWQMGTFTDNRFSSIPRRGATLQVQAPGAPNGSYWVQTYIATGVNDTGQPTPDCDVACPAFTGPGTTSQNFYDAAARYDSSANWFAMTTLYGPNGNPLVTFTWGYMLSSGGISLTYPQVH